MARRSAPPRDVGPASSSLPMWGEDDAPAPRSSRLCVKNIPKHLTLERLREHFAERGEVTDCKIMKTNDGKSRQMAFVGYKTEQHAVRALAWFNNTFVDTSKINVEYARAVKSAQLPRPWSKHSLGSSAHARGNVPEPDVDALEPKDPDRFIGVREQRKMKNLKKHAAEKELEDMIACDPKLAEFMELMAPRNKQKIWDNQDVTAFGADVGDADFGGNNEIPLFEDDEGAASDDDYDQDLDDDEGKAGAAKGVRKKKRPNQTQKRNVKNDGGDESDSFDVSSDSEDGGGDDGESETDTDENSETDESDDEVDATAADDAVSDMDYLKKRAEAFSDTESEEEEDEEGEDEDESDEDDVSMGDAEGGGDAPPKTGNENREKDARVVTADDMEAIAETGRVFARNLPFTATEEEVASFFSKFGALTAVHVLVNKTTRASKGLAYITYALPENGLAAMEALDGSIFQGRLIHLIPAKRPPNAVDTLGGFGRVGGDGDGDDKDGDGDAKNANGNKKPQSEADREAGFKQNRDSRLKQDAGTNKAAWNSLFMRQDTVSAAVAAKYGLSKADLLESGDADVAVRLALGEGTCWAFP